MNNKEEEVKKEEEDIIIEEPSLEPRQCSCGRILYVNEICYCNNQQEDEFKL